MTVCRTWPREENKALSCSSSRNDPTSGKSSRTHGDCEWEITERAQDAVESKFCDIPQATFMFGNSLLVAAPVSLSSQHVDINIRKRKPAGAAMRTSLPSSVVHETSVVVFACWSDLINCKTRIIWTQINPVCIKSLNCCPFAQREKRKRNFTGAARFCHQTKEWFFSHILITFPEPRSKWGRLIRLLLIRSSSLAPQNTRHYILWAEFYPFPMNMILFNLWLKSHKCSEVLGIDKNSTRVCWKAASGLGKATSSWFWNTKFPKTWTQAGGLDVSIAYHIATSVDLFAKMVMAATLCSMSNINKSCSRKAFWPQKRQWEHVSTKSTRCELFNYSIKTCCICFGIYISEHWAKHNTSQRNLMTSKPWMTRWNKTEVAPMRNKTYALLFAITRFVFFVDKGTKSSGVCQYSFWCGLGPLTRVFAVSVSENSSVLESTSDQSLVDSKLLWGPAGMSVFRSAADHSHRKLYRLRELLQSAWCDAGNLHPS